MIRCSPSDGYADCNMKRTGRLDACRGPGGCIAASSPVDELDGLRITEEICAERIQRKAGEAALASFFARPQWQSIRPLLEQIAPGAVAPIEAVIERVRRDVWRDMS